MDGLDATVRAGQTLGVVGESGSGKTTLGLALLRLIASEGPIVYMGKPIDGYNSKMMRPLRKEMQMVFQDPFGSLSPRLSIQQIVEEGLLVQGKTLSQDERRAIVGRRCPRSGSIPQPWTAIRMNSPAGSASASPSRARWRSNPASSCWTSRPPRWTCRCRRRSWICCAALQQKHNLAYLFISHDLKVVRALANEVIVMRNGMMVETGLRQRMCSPIRKTDYTKALIAAALNLKVAPEGVVRQ